MTQRLLLYPLKKGSNNYILFLRKNKKTVYKGGQNMDLLIKGGKVVGAKTTFKADVAVKNDKIVAIGNGLKAEKDTEVVDARGKLVLPGAIDGHTSGHAFRRNHIHR